MFDGIPQPRFPSSLPALSRPPARLSVPVTVLVALMLLGTALTVLLPSDPSDGFHIEFIGP